ncbi:MAG: tRNA (adenosine(37)-N6)-threonylcarbamoyltransferase complex dimerization subunit type 1 TsaB [Actinobacteria bacterium]|nr:tRNA (adenosine(37)-N6)-threonylcarbamoyltransferase complex dimerization subunit type 1 TsaB [Actinomycetota bacterium]
MKCSLAIDTSTSRTIAAIVAEEKIIWSGFHDGATSHGEALGKLIDEAKNEATFNSIDQVVVGMGPGPFTGLRVGIAFTRTFAMAREIPCIGVVSLDAIAGATGTLAGMVSDFYVITDARRKEIYWAKYQKNGERITEPAVAKREEVDFENLPVIEFGFPDPLTLVKLANQPNSVRIQPLYLRKPDAVLPKLAELKYRAMNNFDLGVVLEIEKQLFPDPWNLAQFKEELAGVPKTRSYFVAELAATQKVVGFAGLFCPGGGADADIQTISVSAQYQGNGIGQGLLDLLISVAIERNAPAVFLEVRAENEQARALYAKNGFTQISVRKNYYQNAQPRSKKSDAIIMQKILGVTHE